MRRIRVVVALACVLVLVGSFAKADQEYRVYLPIVGAHKMGLWSIVEPEGTINWGRNPSAEAAANFAAVGGGTATRVTTFSFKGTRSFRIQTAANNQGASWDVRTLSNAIHYATLRVRGTLPASWDWSLDNATYTTPELLLDYDGDWSLYGLQFSAAQSNGATDFYVRQNGAGAGDFYIDAIQVEQKEYWTTYCDGGQPGCEWLGVPNADISQRSELSRAGGRVWDFADLSFEVSSFIGAGMAGVTLNVDPYSVLPGGEMNSVKTRSHEFSLAGVIRGTSLENLHANRQGLIDFLADNTYPNTQPILLRYEGSDMVRQISAYYQSGMAGRISARIECWEQGVTLRFLATDPFFYGIREGSQELDTNDTATLRYFTARLRSEGQWGALGLGANPTTGGVIYATATGPDGKIYVGGTFTGWGGVANRNYIARYNPISEAWETVGGAAALGNTVRAIVSGPDGNLYVGGLFVNAGGDVDADGLAQYNIATDTFSAVAIGSKAGVLALAFGLDGTLYIGGSFINWDGIGAADYIASWDGTAYAALGTGANNDVDDIAINPLTGDVAVAGNLTVAGGVASDGIGLWNGSAWISISSGLAGGGGTGNSVAYTAEGILIFGGNYTSVDGVSANFIAQYNGQTWAPLSSGANNQIIRVRISPDGLIYASGPFTQIGGVSIADRVASWNGSTWTHLDVDLPGTPIPWSIGFGPSDPVISKAYDVLIGFDSTGVGAFSGTSTVTNNGTANSYPRIVLERSGGMTAIIKSIRNETLGLILYLNYDLKEGESLTFDFAQGEKTVISSYYGLRLDAILPNSDFSEWRLRPGDNNVSIFVDVTGAPTIDTWVFWDETYEGMD